MTTTVVFYATDTMADWEYGYLLAGSRRWPTSRPGVFPSRWWRAWTATR